MDNLYKVYESIFNILSESIWGMTIEEIAKQLNMHRNTVSRYLSRLEKLGLIVKKSIGKYTLWLPRNIYNYHKTDIVRRFIEGTISIIYKIGGKEKVRETGREIAKYIMSSLINSVEIILVRGSESDISEILGVYIPTLIPKLRLKMSTPSFSEKVVFLNMIGCPNKIEEFDIVCNFFLGYIEGTIDSLGIPYKNVELVDSIKESGECKYTILLEKTVDEAKKYILEMLRQRGQKIDNFAV